MPPWVLMKVDGSLDGGGAWIHMMMPFICLVGDRKKVFVRGNYQQSKKLLRNPRCQNRVGGIRLKSTSTMKKCGVFGETETLGECCLPNIRNTPIEGQIWPYLFWNDEFGLNKDERSGNRAHSGAISESRPVENAPLPRKKLLSIPLKPHLMQLWARPPP